MTDDLQILQARIRYIHEKGTELCVQHFKVALPNSGNMGVFCQSEEEYLEFQNLQKELVYPSENPNQKYFELIEPIIFDETTYDYLYIRKTDSSSYGENLGDLDFYLPLDKFEELKEEIKNNLVENIEIYNQPGVGEMIQLTGSESKVVVYVSTKEICEKVRIRH